MIRSLIRMGRIGLSLFGWHGMAWHGAGAGASDSFDSQHPWLSIWNFILHTGFYITFRNMSSNMNSNPNSQQLRL
jgi:hypothetical protein